MAQAAGVIGNLFSSLAMAPTVVSYFVDPEWSFVQPSLDFLQASLEKEYRKDVINKSTLQSLKSFINGFGENLNFTAIFVIIMSSMNIFMDIFMLIGSCCNVSCMILPWLVLSMLKFILISIPAVIFFSLLGVYLYVQGLVLPSLVLLSLPGSLALISFIVWLIVLCAYSSVGKKNSPEFLGDRRARVK